MTARLHPVLTGLLALTLASASSSARQVADGDDAAAAVTRYAEVVQRIVHASLAEGRAYQRLDELCAVAPHRLAGSPGGAAAETWARQSMLAQGLSDVRLQQVMAPHWDRGSRAVLRIVAPLELAGETLPILALGGSVPTPLLGLTEELVVVTSVEQAEALGERGR